MTPSPKHIDLAKGITQWNIDRYGVDVEGLRDGIALALAQAESDALERAAKECDSMGDEDSKWLYWEDALDHVAGRIRALKAQP